ncbi:MAG: translocation/assembly module TamB domain-containing protein [Methylotenera sp.]|nr:translocation/assembly module TamB domain-containing protein [Methylotenera sp.]
MLRRHFCYFVFGFVLLAFTPARGEMSISANASLDTFNYDLDNIHLKLEKLDASWQLSPFGEGRLFVEKMRAKRLIVTVGDGSKGAKDQGLPERIKPPFPIKIQQAEVAEVVIISGGESHILSNVKFNLEADTKSIKLNSLRAATPWGEATTTIQMGTAKPFPLTGMVALKKTDSNTPYDVKVQLSGDLKSLRFDGAGTLAKQNGQLAILQSNQEGVAPAASFIANGQLGLADDYPLSANIKISELRPERIGHYPAAKLNFDVDAQGKLLPRLEASLQFVALDSQWQGHAIKSAGKMLIEGAITESTKVLGAKILGTKILGTKIQGTKVQSTIIRNIDFQASIANNNIKASGSLGQSDSRLEWQADLADLRKFGEEYSGNANANGTLTGSFENLSLQFKLQAQDLSLPGAIKAEKLEGQAAVMTDDNGKVEGEFKASNLQYGKHTLADGSLTLQGTRANHQLKIVAQGKEFKFESALQGGLTGTNDWLGVLQNLTFDGNARIKLTAPALLMLNTKVATLEKASLQLTKGSMFIDLLKISSDGFASKGNADQIALEDLPSGLLSLPSTLQGNPVFSGKWDINAADSLNGNFSFWREAGDFTMTTADGTTKPLGLQKVKLEAELSNNHVTVKAKLNGQNVGSLDANLTTIFTKIDSGYALLANAPLTLDGKAQLHTLAWLPLPSSLMDASFDGALNISVAANGTLSAPNLSGNVNGKNLQFSLPTEGVNFSNGILDASFENDQLLIKKASWQGGEGYLTATGSLLLNKGKPVIDLDWTAEKFTAISRADRLLTLNGAGKTTLANDMLTISGSFTVVKGLVELADEDTPALGDDVVILGQTEYIPESALRVLLNGLHIDLGKEFILRGRGLDAELTGAVTLTGLTQYRPHTEGVIQVKKGTYMAYGQVLTIERGVINFNGTVDNPGVNIRAMRNSKPVNAGIEITGTAFLPVTKLVSDPNVPDSEKLSWLVLGHGMDQTTKNDYGLLSLAAGVLLSQGQSVPLQTQLARAAGLDEFSFAGGDATNASVVFGKRLSSRLYLSYQKSISGLLDVARLTFNMTSRWSLRAEAGTESAVDVLYTFSFK